MAASMSLSACESEAPDCASDETRELISDIARSSQNNILVFRLRYSHGKDGRYDNLGWDEYKLRINEYRKDYDNKVVNGIYSLHEIRTESKDEVLKITNCAANLKFEISGFGSEQMPVNYSLKVTSEGVLYGTLDGLTF